MLQALAAQLGVQAAALLTGGRRAGAAWLIPLVCCQGMGAPQPAGLLPLCRLRAVSARGPIAVRIAL